MMSLSKYRLKLDKNTAQTGSASPQYTLKYNAKADNPKHVSYSILSPLIGNDDVIILLSTEFFQNKGNGSYSPISKFVEYTRQLGLFVVERNRTAEENLKLFGLPLGKKKKVEIQELAVYIPNNVWKDSLRDIIPMCGARYLVLQEAISVSTFMNGILDMDEETIANTFSTRIFDLAAVGQMGVSSNIMDQAEISRQLGL
ncbi:MAG: hypothetical protein GX115_16390 [Ruminiclostridium sp.]|nr:hypothetical protein [Ruminiclostridium sp.]